MQPETDVLKQILTHPYVIVAAVTSLIAIGGIFLKLKIIYKALFDEKNQPRFVSESKMLQSHELIKEELRDAKDRMVTTVKDMMIIQEGENAGETRYVPRATMRKAMDGMEKRLTTKFCDLVEQLQRQLASIQKAGGTCEIHHEKMSELDRRLTLLENKYEKILGRARRE